MMPWLSLAALAAILTLIAADLLSVPLSIHVYPPTGLAPLTVRWTVRIQRADLNRAACVGYGDGGGLVRESCWDLEGIEAPITYQDLWEHIEPGEWTAYATVYRADGTKVSERTTFTCY